MVHGSATFRRSCDVIMLITSLICCMSVFGVSSAQAHFEWIGFPDGVFAFDGTEGELGGAVGGVAVNYGCYFLEREVGHTFSSPECKAHDSSDGHVYVADFAHSRVTVFDSRNGFREAWGWGVADNNIDAFQRCGPVVELACVVRGIPGGGTGQLGAPAGVAVNQATGDVYVLDAGRHNGVVQIFSAEGEFISGFGVQGGGGEPVTTNPDLIRSANRSGIAIDQATGDVYVVDHNLAVQSEGRVMVFRPVAPGSVDYEYEKDFAVGVGPEEVAVDAAGDVYLTGNQRFVYRFAAGNLVTPEWVHEDNKEIDGLTVNPGNSEDVFYYTNQNRRFHELKSMEELETSGKALGQEWKGVEVEGRQEIETNGLAFNPGLVWEVGRPAGVLYAVDPHLVAGLVWAEPPLLEPSVGSVSVSKVGTSSALFKASVNPHGFDTHYRFEFGTEDCVEHVCGGSVPVPVEGDVGSGGESRVVSASVSGLLPGTKYFFRVVVSSHCKPEEPGVVCSVSSPVVVPAVSFSTFGLGGGLPDGRVFELVSPSVKNGGEVFPLSASTANCELCMPGVSKEQFPRQVTVDGDRIVYEGDPFAVAGDAVSENEYLSVRGAGGWESPPQDLSPVLEGKATPQGYKGFSSDLSRGVLFEIEQSFEGAPPGYPDLYLKDTVGGSLQPLITEAPSNVAAKDFGLTFAGASSDFSHIIFDSNGVFATESAVQAPGGGLYEWVNGSLRLVNILPGNTIEPNAVFGSGNPNFSHAISADGSRIFWTDTNSGGGHFGRVFVRVDGEKTLEVNDPGNGAFVTASVDGSRVLLSDGRVFNVAGETSVEETDLTNGQPGFQGILGASDDLSSVYYVDTAVLTGSEENGQGAVAEPGKDNLYLYRGGVVRFVATLVGADNATDLYQGDGPGGSGDWSGSPSTRTAQVTSDGRFVAFMSKANLTGGAGGSSVFEVYEFDASTGGLVCASCNPTGEPPVGPSMLGVIQPGSGFLPQPMNLSGNGRLFFDSYDQLSPRDTNGSFEDVYEYEPNDLGTCAVSNGCVFLISSGQEETNSSFVNATPSGSDVFFTTSSRLVPSLDRDDLSDLYDARVGGVAPSPEPPVCSANDTCKEGSSSSSPPALETLPSTIVTGSGNLLQPPPPLSPSSSSSSGPRSSPTRAELLVRSLRACRKARMSRAKRLACEKHSRRLYGSAIKTKKVSRVASRVGGKK